MVHGDPGVGKTALLDYLAGRASGAGCRVARVAGVQSEMELAFARLRSPAVGEPQVRDMLLYPVFPMRNY